MLARRIGIFLLGAGLVGAAAVVVRAGEDEDEQKVSLEQVPAAVKATILKEAQGGTIKEIERETKHGRTIYEAEVLLEGKELEIKVAPDGTLLKKECEHEEEGEEEGEEEVSLDQIPAAARQALLAAAGGAKIVEVERETEHGLVLYEAEWIADGRKHEAEVTAEGALVELEEDVSADEVPAAVKRAAAKLFPPGAKLEYEKKTIIVYEVEAKINGKEREVLLTPAGRPTKHRH